jgi:hypothetical protein
MLGAGQAPPVVVAAPLPELFEPPDDVPVPVPAEVAPPAVEVPVVPEAAAPLVLPEPWPLAAP